MTVAKGVEILYTPRLPHEEERDLRQKDVQQPGIEKWALEPTLACLLPHVSERIINDNSHRTIVGA